MLDILVQKSRETDEKLAQFSSLHTFNTAYIRLPGETVEDSAVEEAAKSLVELPNRFVEFVKLVSGCLCVLSSTVYPLKIYPR